eukprot:6188193-Pleurochrysis_carterae.AAC.2
MIPYRTCPAMYEHSTRLRPLYQTPLFDSRHLRRPASHLKHTNVHMTYLQASTVPEPKRKQISRSPSFL